MDRWFRSLGATALAAALVWLATFEDQPAQGQVIINGRQIRVRGNRANPFGQQPGSEEDLVDEVFLPPDRTAKRRLELAKEMTRASATGEAVRYLGSLLDSPDDYFFRPEAGESVFRSLKAEAGRLIAALPAEAQSYELQFGAKARRMLDEAAASGDPAALAEVPRRFFYTKAGAEAACCWPATIWIMAGRWPPPCCSNDCRPRAIRAAASSRCCRCTWPARGSGPACPSGLRSR